jgi:1,2-diacylglycerol-3-alpha-glucose alpha-1,2-galactosyltransferase
MSRGVKTPQVVIPNAIDLSYFRQDPGLRASGRELLGLEPEERVVLGVGLICLRKGFDEFIEVARINPGFTFVWVGGSSFSLFTDAYFKKHEWMAAAPRNVRFPGILPFEKMPEMYNAADLLFLPTRQETFGLVIAEAAACGLPLVVRDLPDFRELFGDAHLGAEGCGGFSDCIRSVFADSGLARTLREKSLAMVQRFDSRSLAAKLVEAYRELYKNSRNRKPRAA